MFFTITKKRKNLSVTSPFPKKLPKQKSLKFPEQSRAGIEREHVQKKKAPRLTRLPVSLGPVHLIPSLCCDDACSLDRAAPGCRVQSTATLQERYPGIFKNIISCSRVQIRTLLIYQFPCETLENVPRGHRSFDTFNDILDIGRACVWQELGECLRITNTHATFFILYTQFYFLFYIHDL